MLRSRAREAVQEAAESRDRSEVRTATCHSVCGFDQLNYAGFSTHRHVGRTERAIPEIPNTVHEGGQSINQFHPKL